MQVALWILGGIVVLWVLKSLVVVVVGFMMMKAFASNAARWIQRYAPLLESFRGKSIEEVILFAQSDLKTEPKLCKKGQGPLLSSPDEQCLYVGDVRLPVNIFVFFDKNGLVERVNFFGFKALEGLLVSSGCGSLWVRYHEPAWKGTTWKPEDKEAFLCTMVGPRVRKLLIESQGFEALPN